MAATLAKKVAIRLEHTGSAPADRAQRMAQMVGQAHEQTKSIVAALANHSYSALAADTTIAATAYATLLTANITTVLDSGHLVITFTASGIKTTGQGTVFFQVLVDGVVVKGCYTTVALTWSFTASMTVRVPATRGSHTVALQWKTNTNSVHINPVTVVEEHAHLLVQEAL